MDKEKDVSFLVHEYDMARLERANRRQFWTIVLLVLIIFAQFALGMYERSLYDYAELTIDSQDGGNANYIGASGVINNGEGSSQKENPKE